MTLHDLLSDARRWAALDPDPETAALTHALIEGADEQVLRDHFGSRLQFGTAGLRGALGPGPNRMNRVLVRTVSAGLGEYLLRVSPEVREQGVVVGFDGRKNSRLFAEDTAAVLGGMGIVVHLFEDVSPTPETAHAVTHLGASAGVMVTASHNPPADNGYKVYWANGAQIIPPHDGGISDAIDAVSSVYVGDFEALQAGGVIRDIPMEVREIYLNKVLALRVHPTSELQVVYTAMHGVGSELIGEAFARAGLTGLHYVEEQREPDPAFPTVAFPNPEEHGALDLAKARAEAVGADVIIANDPDADRLAVALPDGEGGWRQLSGNQVGCLLAEDLLTHGEQWKGARRLVATTIVSSTLLSSIALAHDVDYAETLTGFKWIANRAIAHDAGGGHFVIGYEEALGYSVGPVVRDKDGVSAALLLCDLAARCKAQGRTLVDALEDLHRRYGLHASRQHSLKLPGEAGATRIREILAALRADPPSSFAGTAVVRRADILTGEAVDLRTGEHSTIDLPSSNVLGWWLEDGSRILARPSGTEPKVKFYFETRIGLTSSTTVAEAEVAAEARLTELENAFLAAAGV